MTPRFSVLATATALVTLAVTATGCTISPSPEAQASASQSAFAEYAPAIAANKQLTDAFEKYKAISEPKNSSPEAIRKMADKKIAALNELIFATGAYERTIPPSAYDAVPGLRNIPGAYRTYGMNEKALWKKTATCTKSTSQAQLDECVDEVKTLERSSREAYTALQKASETANGQLAAVTGG